jgi:general secretion pathway protein I
MRFPRGVERRQGGFSLLEMVVTVAILGLALGALYQAASGATRNVRSDQRYAYAVELARSLVAEYAIVPRSGLSTQGETSGGFRWSASATPVRRSRNTGIDEGQLQRLHVIVAWPDGTAQRQVELHSVVAGSDPPRGRL